MARPSLRMASDADRLGVERFRREVARLLRDRTGVDGAIDPVMDGQTVVAWHLGAIVGCLDVHVGRVDPLPAERLGPLGVASVTEGAAPASVALLDDAVLHPDLADDDVELLLKARAVALAASLGTRWVFTTCVPLEIAAYRALGFAPSASPVRGPFGDTAIPLVLDLAATSRLRELASPFLADAAAYQRAAGRAALPVGAAALTTGSYDALRTPDDRAADAARVAGHVRAQRSLFLDAIDASLRADLLRGANRIEPRQGERVFARGDAGRDVYLVARGVLEAVRDGTRLATLGPGDLVGEIAFAIDARRTADVVAATGDVVLVRLPADHLSALAARDARAAACIWQGIARSLATKLAPA